MLETLSESERAVLRTYLDPAASEMKRATRLSVQYALGSGIFVLLGITNDSPWWAVVTYATFLTFMGLRLVGARRVGSVMRGIIGKYEARIEELEKATAPSSGG